MWDENWCRLAVAILRRAHEDRSEPGMLALWPVDWRWAAWLCVQVGLSPRTYLARMGVDG